jgi:DNA-binding beta-propeller fold protein YncE
LISSAKRKSGAFGKGPEGIDVSGDGARIWTAHSRDGGVSIIDVANKKAIETLQLGTKREIRRMKLGRSPEGILIAPDGEDAFVAVSGDNYVAVLNLKTLEVTGRISTGAPDGMAWAEAR